MYLAPFPITTPPEPHPHRDVRVDISRVSDRPHAHGVQARGLLVVAEDLRVTPKSARSYTIYCSVDSGKLLIRICELAIPIPTP